MALTPLQRQRRKNEINDRFNEYKSVGTTLMQLGKITPEEYYSRVRNKGIQFGVIRPDEYPDDLPGWVEPVFRITGATAGAILSSPGGVLGMSRGAGIGGAAGTAAYQQFAEFFSDDMPMKPATQKLKEIGLAGAVDFTGTAVFGGAAQGIGMGLRKAGMLSKRGAGNLERLADDQLNNAAKQAGSYKLRGTLKNWLTKDTKAADDRAALLGEAGITATLGMVGREGLRYALEALGKMPLIGSPARSAHKRVVKEIVGKYNQWTASARENSGLGKNAFQLGGPDGDEIVRLGGAKADAEFMKNLNEGTPWLLIDYINKRANQLKFGKGTTNADKGYKTLYDELFDTPLKKIEEPILLAKTNRVVTTELNNYVSTYGKQDIPKYMNKFLDPMSDTATLSGEKILALTNSIRKDIAKLTKGVPTEGKKFDVGILKKMRGALIDDASAANPSLREGLEIANRKYQTYESFLQTNQSVFKTAYGINTKLPSSLDAQLDVQAGNIVLRNLTKDKIKPTTELERIGMKTDITTDPASLLKIEGGEFAKKRSMTPQKLIEEYQNGGAVKQQILKEAMGEKNYQAWATMQMDDIFERELFRKGVAGEMAGFGEGTGITGAGKFDTKSLEAALGINNKSGANWARTQAMLDKSGLSKVFNEKVTINYPSGKTEVKTQLGLMIDAMKLIPSAPNFSSFLMRSFTLKGTAGPAAILGGGALAGGAGGFLLSVGPLLFFTHVMSRKYSKDLLIKAVSNPTKYGNAWDEFVKKQTGPEGIFGKAMARKEGMAVRYDKGDYAQSLAKLRELTRQSAVEITGQATGILERPDRELYEVQR